MVSPVAPLPSKIFGSLAGEALAVDRDQLFVLADHLRTRHAVGLLRSA